MIILDSGLGGLSVTRALRAANPGIPVAYVADTAAFPYGNRSEEDIAARAERLVAALENRLPISLLVLACNTLSTLCLERLRERFAYDFVGTVPAIKVAAEQSKTRRFTLLATPNTARSRYTDRLVAEFAPDCAVDSYGAPNLACYAESLLLGKAVDDDALRAEIAPCFHDGARGKTDMVILGCTHFPLIVERLEKLAPWPVRWIDSSQAIARRALALAKGDIPIPAVAYVTREEDVARYAPLFAREGFAATEFLSV